MKQTSVLEPDANPTVLPNLIAVTHHHFEPVVIFFSRVGGQSNLQVFKPYASLAGVDIRKISIERGRCSESNLTDRLMRLVLRQRVAVEEW